MSWTHMPPPMPYMQPPSGCSSWEEALRFHEYMNKQRDEFEKKLKDERQHPKGGKKWSLMEVFALLILLSPFVGIAQVYALKYSIATLTRILQ